MSRIVLAALVLLNCVVFGTETFGQAGQTINPVPLTPPTVNTTNTTCQINCDTQAMTCHSSCLPTTAATAATAASRSRIRCSNAGSM
jgi:hypothetical protein